jgi:nucleoside-diphosphate-sugar epimerase
LLLCAENLHQPINLGNPIETTILDLGELINRLTGNKAGLLRKSAERMPTDPERRRPDITRAKEWLHWEPRIPLEVGIAHTIDDFRTRLGLDKDQKAG